MTRHADFSQSSLTSFLKRSANRRIPRQEHQTEWDKVHPARHVYDWAAIDDHIQFAHDNHQQIFVKLSPVNRRGDPPAWIFREGVPQCSDSVHTYGYYLDPDYKTFHAEMVMALGHHLRNELPAHLREAVSFVRVDTGATGDESPYERADEVESGCQISDEEVSFFLLFLGVSQGFGG